MLDNVAVTVFGNMFSNPLPLALKVLRLLAHEGRQVVIVPLVLIVNLCGVFRTRARKTDQRYVQEAVQTKCQISNLIPCANGNSVL